MRIVVPAGGIGGSRFLRGLLSHLGGAGRDGTDLDVTVIGNTADDITLFGLRVCPDLDTVMYTLGGGIHPEQGWGRSDETFTVKEELAAYGAEPQWFGLGDRDFATHIVRSQALAAGETLSAVTRRLCERWRLPERGVRLLPMSDDPIETHVTIPDAAAPGGRRTVHFQEYWVGLHAGPEPLAIEPVGAAAARPAPGVLEAIAAADVVLLPPSNPVVSIGTVLAVPGIRDALLGARAPIVGISPIIGDAPVRGMADKLLPAIGVETSAAGVGRHYGSRTAGGLLDGWLVDTQDAAAADRLTAEGLPTRAVPLFMTDLEATAAMAAAALELAGSVGPTPLRAAG